MFDLNDETTTRVNKKATPLDRMEIEQPAQPEMKPQNTLDSEKIKNLQRRLIGYYRQELDRQSENRFQMAIDEDYYDHIQWTEEEAKVLNDRGQNPIVYNVLAQSINWIIGSEKRGRTDFKILPRGKEDAKPAERKTKLLKYLSDVNKLPFHRSRAFEDAIKVGIGWLEDGAQDEDDSEMLYSRYESWRNILHDSASVELDGSDMRYIFRTKWVDVDVAKALFPGREAQIDAAKEEPSVYGIESQDGDTAMDSVEFDRGMYGVSRAMVNHLRERVRLIECEYRIPKRVPKMVGGKYRGKLYDKDNPDHVAELASGASRVVNKTMMCVHIMHMTVNDALWEGQSPYKHNRLRFTPIWCYRRGRDNLPYGIIRGMRDIQDDINKRASKALAILSSNKVVMDDGALPDGMDIDEFREEVARPDAVIQKRKGYELDLNVDRDLAAPHLELMSRNINMLQQVGGVTDELLGRTTNAVSGIAVQRRQEQGSLATNKPFDNLRLAAQMQGELQLSLIEQFFTEQKTFRITNERGVPEFIDINDGLPENDITRSQADFIISEADWRASMRQAAVDQLMEVITKLPPQMAILMLDLLVDSMDIPNRDEIAKRIREVTGMKDPDQTEPTPEDMQKEQAKAAANQFQQAMAMAELEGKQTDNASKQAGIVKTLSDAAHSRSQTMLDRVTATTDAIASAQLVIAMPNISKVADGVLAEAGWEQIPAQAGLPQQSPPPQQMALPPQEEMQEPQQNQQEEVQEAA